MKNFLLILFLCFCKLAVFAYDITLTDSVTKTPIFCATVCDADGNYVGRSNVEGRIKLKKGCEYHVSHICYEPKNFICGDSTSIVMSPISYAMPDIVVAAKMKKYYHCKVFFRNIQYVDSCLKYYIDGVREFFIDTKSRKVKRGTSFCRLYQTTNKDITQQKKHTVMVGINPGLAGMEGESLYEKILKDKGKRIEGDIVYGDTTHIGRCEISPDKQEIRLSYDCLYPKSSRKKSLFGYTYILTEDKSTEVYNSDGMVTPAIFDLKFSKRYRHITFSRKKSFHGRMTVKMYLSSLNVNILTQKKQAHITHETRLCEVFRNVPCR